MPPVVLDMLMVANAWLKKLMLPLPNMLYNVPLYMLIICVSVHRYFLLKIVPIWPGLSRWRFSAALQKDRQSQLRKEAKRCHVRQMEFIFYTVRQLICHATWFIVIDTMLSRFFIPRLVFTVALQYTFDVCLRLSEYGNTYWIMYRNLSVTSNEEGYFKRSVVVRDRSWTFLKKAVTKLMDLLWLRLHFFIFYFIFIYKYFWLYCTFTRLDRRKITSRF